MPRDLLHKVGDSVQHTDANGVVYETKITSISSIPTPNQVYVGDNVLLVDPTGLETDAEVVRVATNGPNGQTLDVKVSDKAAVLPDIPKYVNGVKIRSWKIKPVEIENTLVEEESHA